MQEKNRPSTRIYNEIQNTHEVVIYGAGAIAVKLYNLLNEKGMAGKIRCFTQTSEPKIDMLCWRSVVPFRTLDEYDKLFFLVAVASDDMYAEIKEALINAGVHRFADSRKLLFDNLNFDDDELKKRKNSIDNYLKSEKYICSNKKDAIIAHVTYPYTGNAGDTYLSYCVRRFLGYKTWDFIQVTDPVNEEVINTINKTNGLVIGGGGLFLPDTNGNTISGWQWAIPDTLLDEIEVPIFVFSVGYNYFYGQDPNQLFVDSINKLARKSKFFGLRNTGSVEKVRSILTNTLADNVRLQPCSTAFAYKYLNKSRHKSLKLKRIALNMAFDRDGLRFGIDKDMICRNVAKAAYRLTGIGYELCYVAHCDSDFEFLAYLDQESVPYTRMNLSFRLPEDIYEYYNSIDIAIGMRGHSQMIPFGVGCKIITLSTHNKMKWFLEDIDFLNVLVDLSDIYNIEDNIVDRVEYIACNRNDINERQNESINRLYEISVENRDIMDAYIK